MKLVGNADARRAVVAQILSYAAYLQGLHPTQLESQILAPHLRAQGAETIVAVVEAHDQQPGWDPHAFTDGLVRSLADGEFRLVFVLDSVPDELVQVVGYLQLVSSRIEVDLITVSAYEVSGSRILVPQRIEPARRSPELTEAEAIARQVNALLPGSDEFRTVVAETATGDQNLLNRLADWADDLDRQGLVRLSTFRGKAEITTLLPRLAGENVGLVTIYCDKGRAYLQFWRGVFERRAPHSLTRLEALGYEVRRGNTTRHVTDELFDVLSEAYQEATGKLPQPVEPDIG